MSLLKCDECNTIMRTDDRCFPGMNFVWCEKCGKKIEKKTRRLLGEGAKITRDGFIWDDGEVETADWEKEYGGSPGRKPITVPKQ